jgi:hypothetical protein
MSVLIAYQKNPEKKPLSCLMFEPTYFVLVKDMAEARFICEGDLKDCETNIFEGRQVKQWEDPTFPWNFPVDSGITARDLVKKYRGQREAVIAFLEDRMTPSEEIAVAMKFDQQAVLTIAAEHFSRKMDDFLRVIREAQDRCKVPNVS